MTRLPWIESTPCDASSFAELRREVIFRGAKWDPQIGDTSTIARAPLVLRRSAWSELVALTTALARELRALERAVLRDARLLRDLGVDPTLARWIIGDPHRHALSLERFDFHFTDEGWRISEVNADVPGGLHEGAISGLYTERWPGTECTGDVATSIAEAFGARCPAGSTIALVHATAYSDDRQVIALIERSLASVGLVGVPCAPDHLRFDPPRIALGERDRPIEGIYRFFPAEWLLNFGGHEHAQGFARPSVVTCNPATAVAVQSKRLALLWEAIGVEAPTFRALVPESRPVHRAPILSREWLLKPAFGRVGGGIAGRSISRPRVLARTAADAFLDPRRYLAQRRFVNVPWRLGDEARTVCIGMFSLDGRVVGAYGRSTPRPFVDHHAIDTPVLIESSEEDRR